MSRELVVVALKENTFTRGMSSNVYEFYFDVPGLPNGDMDCASTDWVQVSGANCMMAVVT